MDAGNFMTNLQLAYMTVPDQTFKSYMTCLQDDYNNDRRDFTVDSLMEAAVNKYKTIVEAGQWQANSPEQEKIIALQAKIDRWEKKPLPKKSEPKKKKGKGKDRDGDGKRRVVTTRSGPGNSNRPLQMPPELSSLSRRLTIGVRNMLLGRCICRLIVAKVRLPPKQPSLLPSELRVARLKQPTASSSTLLLSASLMTRMSLNRKLAGSLLTITSSAGLHQSERPCGPCCS